MIVLPMVDANVVGSVRGSLDFPISKYVIELRHSPRRLADIWSIFQESPRGFQGSAYTRLVTNRGLMTLDAILSKKKRNQSSKTNDLDSDGNILTEEDLQHKPLGFGQGRNYDTSVEDKLLEQMECDKAAQSAALGSRKNNAASKNNSKMLVVKPTLEHSTVVSGIKVCVGDLPKKRNIDRDLRSAFRNIPGLLDISPSVVGNEKTRDPVCKGFGFLTFDTIDHAESFISSFQGQPISFGKVEKQVTFRITKSNGAEVMSSGREISFEVSRLRIRDKDAGAVAGSEPSPDLGFPRIADITVEAMQEMEPRQLSQLRVEVIQTGEEIGSIQEYDESSGEGSDDDLDLGDEPEIEICSFGKIRHPSEDSALLIDRPQGVEGQHLSEAERRIEELENRLKMKLGNAGFNSQNNKHEEQVVKPRGFKPRKSGARKQLSPKGNNLAAVTHGLKKREREVMTGVLEKYGRSSSNRKP